MNSKLCKDLGIEFPLFAFSHCRDVVAAVTKAGGMGVLGATNLSGEELEIELNWIDSQVNGLPYGVDLIVLWFSTDFYGFSFFLRFSIVCSIVFYGFGGRIP